jgi:hypothetical protein
VAPDDVVEHFLAPTLSVDAAPTLSVDVAATLGADVAPVRGSGAAVGDELPRSAEFDLVAHVVHDGVVTVLIDDPLWWHRGHRWCHLVSDVSYAELHAFVQARGIPRRAFQGDHYDIPEEYRAEMVAAGATEVSSRELLRRLRSAGLRRSPAERRAVQGAAD